MMARHVWLVILAAVALLPVHALAAEVPREPVLRVEPGQHTAMIGRISVDAANRYLVTGSDDKTARIWDLKTGKSVRILRPPIGWGQEGRIYSVAISPDGNIVACAGWTGYEWDSSNSIYLFDRETGQIRHRIKGIPAVLYHLAFSPDGRFLAAGSDSLWVFETAGWRGARDAGYDGYIRAVSWGAGGRLVTGSDDGHIRLHEVRSSSGAPTLQLLAKQRAPREQKPYSVSVTPDGSKVAVGYQDSTRVSVLSGSDLATLYEPDTTGTNLNMMSVTWSARGDALFGAGRYYKGGKPIRRWAEAGRGAYQDLLTGADSTIGTIVALRDGGVAFGSADPSWGVLDASGKQRLFGRPVVADFRDAERTLRVSSDGTVVQFHTIYGKGLARFSLRERVLTADPPANPALAAPLRSGLDITEWSQSYAPKLDGTALKLAHNEWATSYAVAPGASNFVLGTLWHLRGFNRSGADLWPPVPAPSGLWGVNVAGNGKVILGAYGDGTIRWHRMSDGKEILALFPHLDRSRWVLWTPSGYYDAAPGAEDLLGWHVNNGPDKAADFFSVSKFRSTFYRPDVVARVPTTLDEAQAIKLANEVSGRKESAELTASQVPPVVTILSPKRDEAVSTGTVVVRFRLRTPAAAPVSALEAHVNGTRMAQRKDLSLAGGEVDQEIAVAVPARDSAISIRAANRNGWGDATTVRVKWVGTVKVTPGVDIRPTLYVLAIGVSEYQEERLRRDVEFAAKDARDFVEALKPQKGRLYKDVVSNLLVTRKQTETKDDLLKGLVWIEKAPTANDVAMIFLAGHGVRDEKGRYFFLPAKHDQNELRLTALAGGEIVRTISDMAGIAMVFLDTCYSGDIRGPGRGDLDVNGFVNDLLSAPKEGVVFASSTGKQKSLQVKGNGAFTKALVGGLNGGAVLQGTAKITVQSLGVYVGEAVKQLTGSRQTPPKPVIISKDGEVGPDYPLAVVVR